MQDLFSIRRRPPTSDELNEFAKRFRDCCDDWSNYLGDPIYINAEGMEEDAESLREELSAAGEEDLVDILRTYGLLPGELVFVCHPGTGQSQCIPVYTGIREVSLEGGGSVLAEAYHGAEVHLLDAEGSLILMAPGNAAPGLGLGETLLTDCNDDYDQLVKGRPYNPSHVEIMGYALADRMVDKRFDTEPGVVYIVADGPYGSRRTIIQGTGSPHILKGPLRLGMHHVGCRKPVDGRKRLVDLFSFHVGRKWEDLEDFTIQYNTFPFLRGRDDWMKASGGDTPEKMTERHLRNFESEDYVDQVCQRWPNEFQFMPPAIRSDPRWVGRFSTSNPSNFLHADESLRNDRGFIIGLMKEEGGPGTAIYPYIPRRLRRDLDVLMVLHAAQDLFHLPEPGEVGGSKRYDIESFVAENAGRISEILEVFPNAMQYATPALLADKSLVLEALRKDCRLVAFLPSELLDDEEVILQANDLSNPSLRFASERLRRDPGFVRRMIDINGQNIAYADEWMQRDRSFVMEAAHAGSSILKHVPERFKDDEEVMLRVIGDNPFSMRDASDRLRADKDFVLRAIDGGLYYDCVEGPLRSDRDIVLHLAQRRPYDFDKFPEAFRDDREIALAAVSADGYGHYLKHCSERLRDDPEFVLAALTHAPGPLQYASERLRRDRDFLLQAVESRPDCLGGILDMPDVDAAFRDELTRVAAEEQARRGQPSPDSDDLPLILRGLFSKGRAGSPKKPDDKPGGGQQPPGTSHEEDDLPF
jgi:hypothetical protein